MSRLDDLIKEKCPNGVNFLRVGDICEVLTGGEAPVESIKAKNPDGEYIYPVYSNGVGDNAIWGYAKTYRVNRRAVTFSSIGTIGCPTLREPNFTPIIRLKVLYPNDKNLVTVKYIKYALETIEFESQKSSVPNINADMIKRIRIPVPPLEVQNEIVQILDNFAELTAELTAELSNRKKQYEYYRDLLLNFDENEQRERVRWLTIGEIGDIRMCKRILKSQTNSMAGIPFYKIGTFGGVANSYISEDTYEEYKKKYSFPKKGDVLISAAGTIGRTVIYDGEPAYFQDSNIVWLEHDESLILNKYLYYYYQLSPWQVSTGGTIARLYNDNILKAKIAVPSIDEQKRIIHILDNFSVLASSISEGLPAEIEAREKQYAYYRNKLLSFKELVPNA